MRRSPLYTIEGRTMSASAWALEHRMRPTTLIARLTRGMPIDQALTAPLGGSVHPKLYEHGGRIQPLKAWANEAGISAMRLWHRLKSGWKFEDALKQKDTRFKLTPEQREAKDAARLQAKQARRARLEAKRANTIAFEGVTQSIEEHALDYGILASVIRDRLKRGWTVHDAITTPMMVSKGVRLPAMRADAAPGGGSQLSAGDAGPAWGGTREVPSKQDFSKVIA